jgi:2,4-diketo-3-deoxy-L-fuconate hydrolase
VRICRFDDDRLGLVDPDGSVQDITYTTEFLPQQRWPLAPGDPLVAHLGELCDALDPGRGDAALKLSDLRLRSVVTSPTKIMAAPANYRLHVEQDTLDPGVDHGVHRAQLEGVLEPVEELGLFLKASSSLAGPGDGIRLAPRAGRTDYEVELAVVIGRTASGVSAAAAMDCVAGYCLGLDMSVRGKQDRSFRKSRDTFTVLGPWLTTADEIADPGDLMLWLTLNGEERQRSSTSAMTVGIPRLIELASATYTLHPGDVLLTGTPEGVGPVVPGDVIVAGGDGLGTMTVEVSAR